MKLRMHGIQSIAPQKVLKNGKLTLQGDLIRLIELTYLLKSAPHGS